MVAALYWMSPVYRHGDLEAVQDFIAIGKDVNERDGDGRSALHYAVAYSHADIVEELVSSGANLEAQASCPASDLPCCA